MEEPSETGGPYVEDDLPPKPDIENMPPEEGDPPPEEEDEEPVSFAKTRVAREDETIDNEEDESY